MATGSFEPRVAADRAGRHPSSRERLERAGEEGGELSDLVGRLRAGSRTLEEWTGSRGERPEAAGPDLHSEAVGHHLFDRVGLVEDHHRVGREHRPPARQVRSVEVGVHHHHVGRRGARPGILGETLVARRAAEGTGAFPSSGRDGRPRPEVRFEVELGTVAGRGLPRPPDQPGDLFADGGRTGLRVAPRPQRVVGIGRIGRLR